MANEKRRRTKRQADPLTEPIVRPNDLVVALIAHANRSDAAAEQAVLDAASRWVNHQKARKLLLLFERYGLMPDQPGSGLLLSLRLAEKYVEGFRIVERPARGPGRPKGAGRKLDPLKVFKAVETICHEKGCTVSEACRELVKVKTRRNPWRDHPAESLETRYYEQLAAFEAPKPESALVLALEAAAARAKISL